MQGFTKKKQNVSEFRFVSQTMIDAKLIKCKSNYDRCKVKQRKRKKIMPLEVGVVHLQNQLQACV